MRTTVTARFMCFLVCGILGAGVADAELVKSDFATPGDGLLVTDTATGLVWLSPFYTRGKSYNDVVGGFGNLLTTHGFQFATPDQVRAMINSNFDNPPLSPGTSDGVASAQAFFQVFGINETLFCSGTTPPGACPRTQGMAEGPDTLTQLGMITIGDGALGYMFEFTQPKDSFFTNLRDTQLGLWLYRTQSPFNTNSGSNVSVNVPANLPNGQTTSVSLTFDHVSGGGETTVATAASGPPPPSGFKLTNPPVYFDIATTATFSGSVRVCLTWTEGQIANENRVRMFHHENAAWVDVTDPSSLNTTANTICGTAASLSPFALVEKKFAFSGFYAPVDNLPVRNSAKAGAAVPVRFSLSNDEGLDIFAIGYPRVQVIQCDTGASIQVVEETVTAGASGLTYDAATGRYAYIWKTERAWVPSCRQLQLRLNDGETYVANFTFAK